MLSMRKIFIAGLFAGLLTTATAFAQGVSIAAYAGAPFVDVAKTTTLSGISYLAKGPKIVAGAGVQVNLPVNLRLELDALVRPANFRASNLLSDSTSSSWSFPLILQYRFGEKMPLQPFVGIGASFQHLYQVKNAITSGTGAFATNSPAGLLIDAGVEAKLKLFRLSGEVRYTRQFNEAILNIEQLNQAEVLVGFHF